MPSPQPSSGKGGMCGTASAWGWGALCPQGPSLQGWPCASEVSLFRLPGKVPSPSQLSVTELPGDEVQLHWAAAAASGVLVYQIKWTPLGDGKAHEVWGGERGPPPSHTPALGLLRAHCSFLGTPACLWLVSRAPTWTLLHRVDTWSLLSADLCPWQPGHSCPARPGEALGVRDHHPGLLQGRGPQRPRVPPLRCP